LIYFGSEMNETQKNEPDGRAMELFFELFEELPRQGPGSFACTERALRLCGELPACPRILDLGCGGGGQTLHLARLTAGSIVAVDLHGPSVERLKNMIAASGLSGRVSALVGDMSDPALLPGSFDLVWSEGAFYNLGIENALRVCHRLLRPGGRVAFSDAVWLTDTPPEEVRACFEEDYPGMGSAEDALAAIDRSGFETLGQFTLPDEAWWDDFYTPMLSRIESLRGKYAGDGEALAVLEQLAAEPGMYRLHSDCYGYEFFVARR